jgi:hypothetical protein
MPLPRHQDPLLDYLAGSCQDLAQREADMAGHAEDPMVLEVASALQCLLSFSPAASPPDGERYPLPRLCSGF